ncbi:hypothetical protein SCP_0607770 [Sparassis crispa]|uniref:Uncharacterized protein n=1 Tax=Sparassis crispa TaxID=139825 RepID=A0A401GRE5_9APHY|nr:hypothetical protein SCP_0607770 [Sparassis crispa]GBE84797.1 hypothetical protein SCP_0607770 [Sparassis crispa]
MQDVQNSSPHRGSQHIVHKPDTIVFCEIESIEPPNANPESDVFQRPARPVKIDADHSAPRLSQPRKAPDSTPIRKSLMLIHLTVHRRHISPPWWTCFRRPARAMLTTRLGPAPTNSFLSLDSISESSRSSHHVHISPICGFPTRAVARPILVPQFCVLGSWNSRVRRDLCARCVLRPHEGTRIADVAGDVAFLVEIGASSTKCISLPSMQKKVWRRRKV